MLSNKIILLILVFCLFSLVLTKTECNIVQNSTFGYPNYCGSVSDSPPPPWILVTVMGIKLSKDYIWTNKTLNYTLEDIKGNIYALKDVHCKEYGSQ